jgi:hypothetical protein
LVFSDVLSFSVMDEPVGEFVGQLAANSAQISGAAIDSHGWTDASDGARLPPRWWMDGHY